MKDALSPAKARSAQLDEACPMRFRFRRFIFELQCLMRREDGQDLVEYALIIALIALGAAASMKTLATAISTEFHTITGSL